MALYAEMCYYEAKSAGPSATYIATYSKSQSTYLTTFALSATHPKAYPQIPFYSLGQRLLVFFVTIVLYSYSEFGDN